MTSLSGFGSLAAIPDEKITDKITRRVLAGQKGMMVFRIDKERRVLEAGGIATIPGGVEHEGYCHEDTEVIDIFAPPREDFLAAPIVAAFAWPAREDDMHALKRWHFAHSLVATGAAAGSLALMLCAAQAQD